MNFTPNKTGQNIAEYFGIDKERCAVLRMYLQEAIEKVIVGKEKQEPKTWNTQEMFNEICELAKTENELAYVFFNIGRIVEKYEDDDGPSFLKHILQL